MIWCFAIDWESGLNHTMSRQEARQGGGAWKVTLRLLTDTARRKRLKLYVTFVDFTKAYDKVPRNVMLSDFKRLGSGMTMLLAIVAIYRVTGCIVGTAVVTASVGEGQGSSKSCLLFIIFVNDLITLIKQN